MHFAQEPDALEGGEAHQDVGVVGVHAVVLSSGKETWCASLQPSAVSGMQRRKMFAFRHIWMRGCVFRMKSATDSIRKLPPIPDEACH